MKHKTNCTNYKKIGLTWSKGWDVQKDSCDVSRSDYTCERSAGNHVVSQSFSAFSFSGLCPSIFAHECSRCQ